MGKSREKDRENDCQIEEEKEFKVTNCWLPCVRDFGLGSVWVSLVNVGFERISERRKFGAFYTLAFVALGLYSSDRFGKSQND